jgi:transglutaminase-like putative cysteine protease
MKFKIIHETCYEFNDKVFLEPHYFRFKPKYTPFNTILSYNFSVSPKPTGISEQVDEENNLVHFCWFDNVHSTLKVVSESIIEAKEQVLFNFLISPSNYTVFPFIYPKDSIDLLSPNLAKESISSELLAYGKKIQHECNSQTLNFLTALTSRIHSDFTIEYREIGTPHAPQKTFELKEASCRDVAWMQIQLLRNMGFATRFVSGYFYIAIENPNYELHAWLEVYLPGAGWIGLDPSNGVITGQQHITIAASAHYQHTMPVTGSIRGNATSNLSTRLSIEVL